MEAKCLCYHMDNLLLKKSDFGWGLISNSLVDLIAWLDRLHNPRRLRFLITEHGCADESDLKRQPFLKDSLLHLAYAVSRGLPVFGYTHWTLIDNYEWSEGMKMKFGLFAMDPETKERRIRKSAEIYQEFIEKAKQNLTVND